jgi:peptidoglycan biosynthesis protein MviN/MurJ (putative lipid II flippase)
VTAPAAQPPAAEAAPARVAGSALVTSLTTIAAMALGGVLAIVVLLVFGKGARTDGFFAAYGVYAVIIALAQSLRASAVARLVQGSLFDNLDRLLGASLLILLGSGVVLVGLGDPLAELLTGEDGGAIHDAARTALAVLWVAGALHVVAALGAAALGALDEFALPGIAYVAGGLIAIAFVLALHDPLGIDVVSLGLVCGALTTAGLMAVRLRQRGWRPRWSGLRAAPRALGVMALVLAGSVGSIALQLTYVVTLAFAARIGEGAVTLYSYSFFASALLMGAVVGPAAIVLAAPVARTWDRRPRSLDPHLLAVFRAGLVLIVPVTAAAVLIGDEIVELFLGSELSAADADVVVRTFLALFGMVVATLAVPVPGLAAFAASRYLAVGSVAVAGIAVHLGLTAAMASAFDTLESLAAAASASAVAMLAMTLAIVYGRELWRPLGALVVELARVAAVAAVAFGPPGLAAAALGGPGWDVAAALVGSVAFLLLLRASLPRNWELVLRIAEPLRTGSAWRA